MFHLRSNGSYKRTEDYLRALSNLDIQRILRRNGELGVAALARVTPRETGRAADSWKFKVTGSKTSCTITWYNTDVENGFPVAIRLHYGYATGTGGYVEGTNFINTAMRPIFDKIEADVSEAVKSIR